ncbi:MAG: hypothetical protein OXP74_01810 [Acidobacteriota bacterium]|nr:hypothetical protein [Acidobacteriota bacterium]
MSQYSYSNRRRAQRSAYGADEAEMASMREISAPIDRGMQNDHLADAILDESDADSLEARDLAYDTLSGEIRDELQRRRELLEDAYPFSVSDGSLRYRPSSSRAYEFFLTSALGTNQQVQAWHELPRLFERVAAELVSRFFGEFANAHHVGSHRDDGIHFKPAWVGIAEATGEWAWHRDDDLPDSGPPSGDEGCDYLIHLQSPDGRQTAQLFVLGQCSCGNDWENKLDDLSIPRLEKWFSGNGHIVPPVRTFATPLHITDTMLKESSRRAGLLFDRARLTMLAESLEDSVMKSFSSRLRSVVDTVAASL